jgi:hypothetical protein
MLRHTENAALSYHESDAAASDFHALSQEDLARLVYSFRGHPKVTTPTLRFVARSNDGLVPAYVWDEESAMVWILD